MARFLLQFGVPPSEFLSLTRLQRQAIEDEAKRIHEAMKRKR